MYSKCNKKSVKSMKIAEKLPFVFSDQIGFCALIYKRVNWGTWIFFHIRSLLTTTLLSKKIEKILKDDWVRSSEAVLFCNIRWVEDGLCSNAQPYLSYSLTLDKHLFSLFWIDLDDHENRFRKYLFIRPWLTFVVACPYTCRFFFFKKCVIYFLC